MFDLIYLADDPAPSFDAPLFWVNLGVLGVVFVVFAKAFMSGWIYSKSSVDQLMNERGKAYDKLVEERDRLIKERDKVQEQRDALADTVQKNISVIEEFVATMRVFVPVLQRLQQLTDLLPGLQRLIDRDRGERGPGRKY